MLGMQTRRQQKGYTTYVKMVKIWNTALNAGEDVEPQASCVAGRMQNDTTTLEDSFAFLLKLNIFTM